MISRNDVLTSKSLASLNKQRFLPEPYSDIGYFFMYYSIKDYKEALCDILSFIDKGLRIYYDRKKEKGASWEDGLLSKAKSFSCRSIVIYLSPNVLNDGFFWQLLRVIKEQKVLYCSINLSEKTDYISLIDENDKKELFEALFNKDITYIPYALSIEEKIKMLEIMKNSDPLVYRIVGDEVHVIGVKSLSESNLVIPPVTIINNKEYPVTEIEPFAFINCLRLKRIHISEGIKHIGLYRYGDEIDENKESVYDPEQNAYTLYETNGGGVFRNCRSLEEVIYPDSVEEFNNENFVGCLNLKRIVLGQGVKKLIGHDLLTLNDLEDEDDPVYLGELVLNSNFFKKGDRYFIDDNGNVTEIYLDQVKKITGYSKKHVGKQKHIDNPASLYIEDKRIEILDLSQSQETVFNIDVSGAKNLKKAIFPPRSMNISCDFSDCKNLKEVDFGNNVDVINCSFGGCESFKKLYLPESVSHITKRVFQGASLETLVSDSFFNDQLFASENAWSRAIHNKSLSKRRKIFFPLLMLFGFFGLLATRYFLIGIVMILFFPITVPIACFRHIENAGDYINVKEIYLRKGKNKPVKIRKYRIVPSDKEGYTKYVHK